MPKVSVLIPFRNTAKYVQDCIDSMQAQTYSDFEVVWVDDHSEDETARIIMQAKDARFQLIQNVGNGIADALNTGLQYCSAPYIGRMDADDLMPANRLALQATWLDSHPNTGLVSGQVALFPNTSENAGYARYVSWINRLQTDAEIRLARFVESPLAHPSVMFRKSLIMKFGSWEQGDFPEDYALWLQWLEAGVVMEKIPELVLHWRDHGARLSRQSLRYREEAFAQVKLPYLLRYLEKVSSGREIWIWGDGRKARKFAGTIAAAGISIQGKIEVDLARCKGNVMYYTQLGEPQGRFVLSAVGNAGASTEIRDFLLAQGWQEGIDFVMCA